MAVDLSSSPSSALRRSPRFATSLSSFLLSQYPPLTPLALTVPLLLAARRSLSLRCVSPRFSRWSRRLRVLLLLLLLFVGCHATCLCLSEASRECAKDSNALPCKQASKPASKQASKQAAFVDCVSRVSLAARCVSTNTSEPELAASTSSSTPQPTPCWPFVSFRRRRELPVSALGPLSVAEEEGSVRLTAQRSSLALVLVLVLAPSCTCTALPLLVSIARLLS